MNGNFFFFSFIFSFLHFFVSLNLNIIMCLLSFYETFFCQTLFQAVDFVIKFKNYQNILNTFYNK